MNVIDYAPLSNQVYRNGEVCISILHAPGEDEFSGELASERWMPTQTVASIMLSVISMLDDPNLSSPANVEASVMYRDRRQEFIDRCSVLVTRSKTLLPAHINIPHPETDEKQRAKAKLLQSTLNDDDFGEVSADEIDDHEKAKSKKKLKSSTLGSSANGKKKDTKQSTPRDMILDENELNDEDKALLMENRALFMDRNSDDVDGADKESNLESSSSTQVARISISEESKPPRTRKDGKAEKDTSAKKGSKSPKVKEKDKTSARREVLEQKVDSEDEDTSSSSALDSKELENLLQLDPEFSAWKSSWAPLNICKAGTKGWSIVKGGACKSKHNSTNFSILTYNLLRHSTAEASSRTVEQLKLLRESGAHVLVLNDALPSFVQILSEQAFLSGYYCAYAHNVASASATRADGSDNFKSAATIVVSKSRILQAQVLQLPSRSERSLVRVECEYGGAGSSILIIAAHLDDSPRDLKIRFQQLSQLLKGSEGFTPHNSICTTTFYVGDFGFPSTNSRDHKLLTQAVNPLVDAWSSVHPGEAGLTYDPEHNKMARVLNSSGAPARRSRILFRAAPSSHVSPTDASLLGTNKLQNLKYKGAAVWPSDHYALVASFSGLSESSSSSTSSSKRSQKCVIS